MKRIFLVKREGLDIPKKILNHLQERFTICHQPDKAEIILVLGGDGTMLKVERQYRKFGLPFCGLNYGHAGFLMNEPTISVLKEIAKGEFEVIKVKLLQAKPFDAGGRPEQTEYAFNEFYMERAGIQTAKIRITVNQKIRFDSLICDGVIVCGSAGSTAYNAASGGMILPIGTNSLVVTGICPAIFHHWRTAQLSSESVVVLEAIEYDKRPVRFLADGILIPNVAKAEIKYSHEEVKIVFVKSQNFQEKVLAVQFSS